MLHPLWLHLDEISKRLRTSSRLRVACDFDGTLTEIVTHPREAVLTPRTRKALEQIAQLSGAEVGILSGRMLKELMTRVPIDGLFFSGIAGLETYYQKEPHLHVRDEELIPDTYRETMREWCGRFEGAWVEDKGPAFALHYRAVPERFQPAFCSGVRRRFAGMQSKIRLLHGKKVFDVLPAIDRDKATALWEWVKTGENTALFYFGDDANDEPVYPQVKDRGGFTVAIGRWSSRAEYGLPGPKQVTWFLEWLEREWKEVGGKGVGEAEAPAEAEATRNGSEDGVLEPAHVEASGQGSENEPGWS